jgi:hypothetical protein
MILSHAAPKSNAEHTCPSLSPPAATSHSNISVPHSPMLLMALTLQYGSFKPLDIRLAFHKHSEPRLEDRSPEGSLTSRLLPPFALELFLFGLNFRGSSFFAPRIGLPAGELCREDGNLVSSLVSVCISSSVGVPLNI